MGHTRATNTLIYDSICELKEYEKWTVSRESWSDPLYPKCCYGPAYVLTSGAIIKIIKAYEEISIQFSRFEDVFITGKF